MTVYESIKKGLEQAIAYEKGETSEARYETVKCDNCYLRFQCGEQIEFSCKYNDYCKYMPESK